MSRIFITGDVHCPIDLYKLNKLNFPAETLTKDDYVIICGDGGFVWFGDKRDRKSIEWITNRPWTTIYVDGNHENHSSLSLYPEVEFHGAKAHKLSDSLYHIKRGEIMEINGYSFFCFGGAFSHDRQYRMEDVSWWQSELPTQREVDHALDNLKKYNNKVNFIITHDVDEDTSLCLSRGAPDMDAYDGKYVNIQKFFNHIKEEIEYDMWFAGHYHVTQYVNDIQILYNEIIEIGDNCISYYQGRIQEIANTSYSKAILENSAKEEDLYISLQYEEIGKLDDFSKYNDTVYPLAELLEVLEDETQLEAVEYLYKKYLMKLGTDF